VRAGAWYPVDQSLPADWGVRHGACLLSRALPGGGATGGEEQLLVIGGAAQPNLDGPWQRDIREYTTANGWRTITAQAPWLQCASAAFDQSNGDLYVLQSRPQWELWRSTDGGVSFTLSNSIATGPCLGGGIFSRGPGLAGVQAVGSTPPGNSGSDVCTYLPTSDTWTTTPLSFATPNPPAIRIASLARWQNRWLLLDRGGDCSTGVCVVDQRVWACDDLDLSLLANFTLLGDTGYAFHAFELNAFPARLTNLPSQEEALLRVDMRLQLAHVHRGDDVLRANLTFSIPGLSDTYYSPAPFEGSLMLVGGTRAFMAQVATVTSGTPSGSPDNQHGGNPHFFGPRPFTSAERAGVIASTVGSFVFLAIIVALLLRWDSLAVAKAHANSKKQAESDSAPNLELTAVAPKVSAAAVSPVAAQAAADEVAVESISSRSGLASPSAAADGSAAAAAAPSTVVVVHLDGDTKTEVADSSPSPVVAPASVTSPTSAELVAAEDGELPRWRWWLRLIVVLVTVLVLPLTQFANDLVLVAWVWSPCVLAVTTSESNHAVRQIIANVTAVVAFWQLAYTWTRAWRYYQHLKPTQHSRELPAVVVAIQRAFVPDADSRVWSVSRASGLLFTWAHGLVGTAALINNSLHLGGFSPWVVFSFMVNLALCAWALSLDVTKVATPMSLKVRGGGFKAIRMLMAAVILGAVAWFPAYVLRLCHTWPAYESMCGGVASVNLFVDSTSGLYDGNSGGPCWPLPLTLLAEHQIIGDPHMFPLTQCRRDSEDERSEWHLVLGRDSVLLFEGKMMDFADRTLRQRVDVDFRQCKSDESCPISIAYQGAQVDAHLTDIGYCPH
jgi:hypothetical protein